MFYILFLFRTKASIACALTMLQCLPEKIRPIVKPLMESIKKESNEMLQVILHISKNIYLF
jgi:spore maturation protein SpmA